MIRTERPESSAGVLGTIDSSAMSEVECFVVAPPRRPAGARRHTLSYNQKFPFQTHHKHSFEGALMRKILAHLTLLSLYSLGAGAQAASTQTTPTAKPAAGSKTVVHHAATGQTTAVIDTTVGKMTCTLFPDKAPIGVANFIGFAAGTKDWKEPGS